MLRPLTVALNISRTYQTLSEQDHARHAMKTVTKDATVQQGEHMTDFFLGIAFGVLLVAVPSFILGILIARRKDEK